MFKNVEIDAFIIGFNHNSTLEGTNLTHFLIGQKLYYNNFDICFYDDRYGPDVHWSTSGDGYFVMNTTAISSGGWKSSYMRNNICGTELSTSSKTFITVIPEEVRSVIKPVTKYTDNVGGKGAVSSYVTATTDYFFLLSEYEIFATTSFSNEYERNWQSQYSYYYNGNSKTKYLYLPSSAVVKAYWWLRSPRASINSVSFVVMYDESADSKDANISLGFAPAFAV